MLNETKHMAVIMRANIFAVYAGERKKNGPSEISLLHFEWIVGIVLKIQLQLDSLTLLANCMYILCILAQFLSTSSVYIRITTLVSARLKLIRMEFSDPCRLNLNLQVLALSRKLLDYHFHNNNVQLWCYTWSLQRFREFGQYLLEAGALQ